MSDRRTDGGATSGSRFDVATQDEMSRRERAEVFYDQSIRAPFRILWEDWRGRIGVLILGGYVLMGTVGVVVVDVPFPNDGPILVPPFTNPQFPLGTDGLGQGMLALIIHSTPAMLEMVAVGALFATGVAVGLGTLSGYDAGVIDRVIMTATDIVITIPGLPLVLVISSIIQPRDPAVVAIVLAIDNWPGLTRSLRSQVLTLRRESYVEASRALGLPTTRILRKDIIPQLMPYISINFMGAARGIIFNSVGLYFLGVLPFSNLNWGVIMNLGQKQGALYTLRTVHWILIPMVAIVLFSLSLILISQGFDSVFNPRVRARHASTINVDQQLEEEEGADTTIGVRTQQ
ncbi:MAG: ABC transporter permease [Halobacteriaceae archaeon]